METITTGTLAGTGSFRCGACDYLITLEAQDALPPCPGCGAESFLRASLFGTAQFEGEPEHETAAERRAWVSKAKAEVAEPGQYLAYEDGDRLALVPLTGEWVRMGRSLAADVRFDDPTVSRRHALVVRGPAGCRVLDDRSLNGVFLNGERVEAAELADGDEIVVGRYRIHFLDVAEEPKAGFLRFGRGARGVS